MIHNTYMYSVRSRWETFPRLREMSGAPLDLTLQHVHNTHSYTTHPHRDSYWILEGILLCGMDRTAQNMIENLAEMVDRYDDEQHCVHTVVALSSNT